MVLPQCSPKKRKTGAREWSDVSFNFLLGCANDCDYCYAKKMAFRYGRITDVAQWKNMQLNNAEICGQKIPHGKLVMFPTTHDLFPRHYDLIVRNLFMLLENDNRVLIVTKPREDVIGLLLNELKWMSRDRIEFRFTITAATPEISLKHEPGAPLPAERVRCLKLVLDAGFPVSISSEPYLEKVHKIVHLVMEGIKPHYPKELKAWWFGAMNWGYPRELRPLYTLAYMREVVNLYHSFPNVHFKDSFQTKLHIDEKGEGIKKWEILDSLLS